VALRIDALFYLNCNRIGAELETGPRHSLGAFTYPGIEQAVNRGRA
jgi:hypothetical protein